MKPIVTRIGVILALCSGGLAVSQALSWERWVVPVQVAGEAVLDQERRPATSPVRRSRFARPVPRGWAAPSLVGERDRPDEPWRGRLTQLGLPVTAQAPRLGVEPAGVMGLSMERDAGAPLPRVRLVADVLEAMPDMCDERIFVGKWYCGIHCGIACRHEGEVKLRREVDAEGYQIISFEETSDSIRLAHARWKVDRKWHPTGKGDAYAFGRPLVALSCNGKSDSGHSVLSVNHKEVDGSDHKQIRIYMEKDGSMRFDQYNVWWADSKVQKKLALPRECRRSYERYP